MQAVAEQYVLRTLSVVYSKDLASGRSLFILKDVGSSVVDPDPQGSGTFAGSVTRGFRIRIRFHIRKWM
jgi:hypothetical protein